MPLKSLLINPKIKALALLCFFHLVITTKGHTQFDVILEDSLLFSKSYQDFQIDRQGYYYLSLNDQLVKLSAGGDTVNLYSNKLLGEISSFDVSLSLKIPIFYQDLSQVVFVDNTISPLKEIIELDELELEQVTLTCSSQQGGIWVYDAIAFSLIRFDRNMNELSRSPNFSQLFKKEVKPSKIMEKNDLLFVWTEENGTLIFDVYGGYMKTLHFDRLLSVFSDELVLVEDNGETFLYNFENASEVFLKPNILSDCTAAHVQNRKIHVLRPHGLFVYAMVKSQ
ncbi:MAG: hypothetical protein MRY83_02200 [Flavobacteriales bacterium]|nr:hypothetical protein [Flavobacteriales bacterium]